MKANLQTERCDGQNLRRQSAVCLLLLTLLAANPFQALGQGVINWNSTTGVYLNNYFSPPTNSVTANSSVTINNSSSGNDAVSGDTHTWNLTINGSSLNGSYNGVNLTAGGSVNNSGGYVEGGDYGVTFDGKAGSVRNSGQIYGDDNDAVRMRAGGSVNNLSGGTIQGNTGGVKITGGSGTVNNAGSITGERRDGVYMDSGGAANNLAGGIIYGNRYGVEMDTYGGAGYVTNYGSIQGYYRDGVRLRAGGTVNNDSGDIVGNTGGVKITGGAGTVINGGAINGENADGVSMDSGGSVYNFQNPNYVVPKAVQTKTITDGVQAGIQGGQNGVVISGGTGNVYNNSSIIGGANTPTSTPSSVASAAKTATVGYDGVYLGDGGSVYNDTNGTISGTDNGVNVNANPSSVVNRGSIYGGNSGVYMGQGSSLSNLAGGTITGGDNGVYVSGGAANVYNRGGSIAGQAGDGVFMNSGGIVVNKKTWSSGNEVLDASIAGYMSQASIEGAINGVEISGDIGCVTNSGSITGDTGTGVRLEAGGIVVNQTSQHHRNNGGNDSETASSYIGNNNPTITGGDYGVIISGDTGTVINSGTIMGITNAGVLLTEGGTVVNQTSQRHGNNRGYDNNTASEFNGNTVPTISGGNNGVLIFGGLGFVTNSGSISGGNGAGVWLADGGTVVNQTSQRHGNNRGYDNESASSYNNGNTIPTIEGGDFGVLISGSTNAVVINSGTIIGTNNAGVRLEKGGTVINQTSRRHGYNSGYDNESALEYNGNNIPTISGGNNGVVIVGGTGYVHNDGDISAVPTITPDSVASSDGAIIQAPTPLVGNGVIMSSGGTVDNGRHGTIEGYNNGVVILGGTGYVSNDGDISVVPTINPASAVSPAGSSIQALPPVSGNGVYLGLGGTVDNGHHGTISGVNNGVMIIGGTGYVSNDGSISGEAINVPESAASSAKSIQLQSGGNGVYLGDGGTVENNRRGSIEGHNGYGVEIYGGPGVVVNSGSISGANGTAIQMATALTSGFSNSVTLKTHSEVIGDIFGGNNGADAAFLQGHGQYDYNFSGFATLTVDASNCRGGWNLTGNNSFTTNVTVEYGLLRINGSMDTPLLTVDEGATLGGTGTISGIVENFGYLTPGNSIGTQTYGTLVNWSDYDVQLDAAGNSDLILVSNTATINSGNVIVQPARQIYGSNTLYTILTATNGVFGTFGTNYFEPQFSPYMSFFLTGSLSYDTNNVYLNLHRAKFATVANTINQNAVAGALDGIVDSPTPGMSNLVTEFFWLSDGGTARAALDSLSGEIHGTMGMLDIQQQDAFNNSIAQRTGRLSAGGGNGGFASSSKPVQLASAGSTLPPMQQAQAETNLFDIWLQGFATYGHLDNDGNALGGDYYIHGVSGGLDYRLTPKLLIGLGLGYSHDYAEVGGPGANGKVDALQIAGYGGYVSGPWHLDGILSYGFLQTDTKRFINVGSISQEADGKYDGGVLSVSAEGGYAYQLDWLTVEPTIGLDYAHLSQDRFNETGTTDFDGNNYGLKVNSVDMDSFRSALGMRLAAQFGKKNGVQFIPALRAVWEHEFADRYADVNANFVGGSGAFDVRGLELGADTAVLGGGLTIAFNKSVQGFVNYDANLNSQLTSSTISGGLSISW